MLAAESIAGDDGGLEVILGLGVVLTFAGLLLRAVCRPVRPLARRDGRDSPARRCRPAERRAAGVVEPRAGQPLAGRARELAALADLCEPESRRLSEGAWHPWARTLNVSRRLLVAEESVAVALAGLPVEAWLVERNVLVGALRIPFLALGATGVFAICPDGRACAHPTSWSSSTWPPSRCVGSCPAMRVRCMGRRVSCFEDLEPRRWFGGEAQNGRGAWQLSLDWLLPWMFSFGPEHGLRRRRRPPPGRDLRVVRESLLCGPSSRHAELRVARFPSAATHREPWNRLRTRRCSQRRG